MSVLSIYSSYILDLAYSFTNCLTCFPSTPSLKINSRSFRIQRLLGEGGFSYVYLVLSSSASPTDPNALYALKKIRCPFGQESVAQALKEVEAYALFSPHPNIIHAIDHSIVADKRDTGQKTVYILLPYYRRGNLQDIINANLVNHTKFPERRLCVLILGVCRALKSMHHYRVKRTGPADGMKKAKKVRKEAVQADMDAADEVEGLDGGVEANSSRRRKREAMRMQAGGDEEEEPLMDDVVTASQVGVKEGEIRAYAHRDIKPGNIMIADDGKTPILMDLGSIAPSPTPITSRSQAIAVQDEAAEHSTMPYRAPELFDVKTDALIDTKVDIWSLGCTMYACLVGKSPFEARSEETGGSLTMCVLGGDWRFPDEGAAGTTGKGKQRASDVEAEAAAEARGRDDDHGMGEGVRDVVRKCLTLEPGERPDVDELIEMLQNVIAALPVDDGGDDL